MKKYAFHLAFLAFFAFLAFLASCGKGDIVSIPEGGDVDLAESKLKDNIEYCSKPENKLEDKCQIESGNSSSSLLDNSSSDSGSSSSSSSQGSSSTSSGSSSSSQGNSSDSSSSGSDGDSSSSQCDGGEPELIGKNDSKVVSASGGTIAIKCNNDCQYAAALICSRSENDASAYSFTVNCKTESIPAHNFNFQLQLTDLKGTYIITNTGDKSIDCKFAN